VQIDVSVNAPQSGKIVELLAQEEDTVTVGQDLFIIEPGEVEQCTDFMTFRTVLSYFMNSLLCTY
jgi:uncharacterized protein (AIM24 family)